ncbi:unnamed protein product, partial [Didymodactylos carnosus]
MLERILLFYLCIIARHTASLKGYYYDDTESGQELSYSKVLERLSNLNLNFLPLKHLENNCYSRAYFISMILATYRIPSILVYIHSSLNYDQDPVVLTTESGKEIKWRYHVAPLISFGSKTRSYFVIDPAVSSRHPILTQNEWIYKLRPKSGLYVQYYG